MSAQYKAKWPMDLGAPAESLEAKQPDIDNGLDVYHPSRYYSHQFKELEEQNLWPRVWLLAGVTTDIPEDGDFFVFSFGREEFIVVRQEDESIKAFYNVCPHRGNRVCLARSGAAASFACSFHGWRFDIDGSLDQITDEDTFDPRLVAHRPGLTEVACDSVGGIIFINMDGKAPPLKEYLGLPEGYIEQYEVDKMHVVHHVRSEWNANWKIGVDAFYETYHLPYVHPQTQGVMEDFSQNDLYPNGASRMIVPICVKSHRVEDQESVDPYQAHMMMEAGLDPATFEGSAVEVREAVQKAKRERAERLGLDHYSNFTDGQLTDSWATGLFPNVQMGMHPEGVFIMRFIPDAKDPEKFVYDTMILFRPVDDPDYDVPAWMGLPEGTDCSGDVRPEPIWVPAGESPNLGEVLDQDAELLPIVQQGVRSRGYRGALYGDQEQRVRHFEVELERYINGEK
ncbi:MAG: aromatic ring-hydroxylating dioxygenase subunit alpha [Pseudomonadota bacterium]